MKYVYPIKYYQEIGIIHSCNDRTPYTYLIGWSKLNKWYYGKRTGLNCHPTDFWTLYFTSSKYVTEFRKQHGEPDVVQIRRIFDSTKKCNLWEEKVLTYFDVMRNKNWLNRKITSKWDNTNKSAAKNSVTGEKLGLVTLDDPRWKTGEIITTSKGTHYVRTKKKVYNIYTGETVHVLPGVKENYLLNTKLKCKSVYAEEISTSFVLGKIPVTDPLWKTGKIIRTRRSDRCLRNFIKQYGLKFVDVTIEFLNQINVSSNQKEAFILCYFKGYSIEYASKELDCSLGAIKTHCHRCKEKIVKKLKIVW